MPDLFQQDWGAGAGPQIMLAFPVPERPISMNEGDSWDVRRRAGLWRDRAHWAWCEVHPGEGPSGRRFPPADVFVTIPFRASRTRDPINYAKTVKHIVDGFVQAGAWPDDNPDWVTQHVPTLVVERFQFVHVRVAERGAS